MNIILMWTGDHKTSPGFEVVEDISTRVEGRRIARERGADAYAFVPNQIKWHWAGAIEEEEGEL